MPETPPYSSITAARWKRSVRIRLSRRSSSSVSGTKAISRATSVSEVSGRSRWKMSLMWMRPMTWSRSPSQSGKRVWPLRRAIRRFSASGRSVER